MKKFARSYRLPIITSAVVMLALSAQARAEPLPPVAKSIKAEETAILLVDFQANFVSPDGAWYGKFAEHYAKTRMLERTVELVKKGAVEATIDQAPEKQGFAAVDLLVKYLHGEAISTVDTGVGIYDKSNIDQVAKK